MEIKDRIKKLAPYFKEMQIVTIDGEQVIYIVVSFPKDGSLMMILNPSSTYQL